MRVGKGARRNGFFGAQGRSTRSSGTALGKAQITSRSKQWSPPSAADAYPARSKGPVARDLPAAMLRGLAPVGTATRGNLGPRAACTSSGRTSFLLVVLRPSPQHPRSPNSFQQSAPLKVRRTWSVVPPSRTTTATSLHASVEPTMHSKARNPRIFHSRRHGGWHQRPFPGSRPPRALKFAGDRRPCHPCCVPNPGPDAT